MENKDDVKTIFLNWASAGIANALTSSILNPMDVSKTRLQIQNSNNSSLSLLRTLKGLYKEAGVIGLWRPGLSASIIREFLSSGPRAGFYVPIRNTFNNYFRCIESEDTLLSKILAALVTGTMGALIANPIDVVKIRLMAETNAYSSITAALKSIYRNEGFSGLYKGLFPSTLRG
jgi:hypothetical protein